MTDLLLHSHNTVSAELWIVYCLFKQADCTNRGSQPSSPGLSAPSQSQTVETNQIITITITFWTGKPNSWVNNTRTNRSLTHCTSIHMWAELTCLAVPPLLWTQKGQKGQHFLQTHTHTQNCREAPHMGFSSEAVASWTSVQWVLPLIVANYITSTTFARDVLTIFLILSDADIFPLPHSP